MSVLSWDAGPVVIGEVAQAHDGSLGFAHAFIDAIADAGAHAVKFQTHIAAAESRPDEPWRVKFSYEDDTRYAYWQRMEFSEPHWVGLREHAEERGLVFLSSPFSLDSVELLERVGVGGWKIASGEIANVPLLDRVAGSELPVILSTGMSPWREIDDAVDRMRRADARFAVLQCTSAYPPPPSELGLNVIGEIVERYGCAAGLSDHSGTIYPALAAVALGASVVEVHVTLSREMFGPDVKASVTTAELRQLVEGTANIAAAMSNPVDKDAMAERMEPMRALFTKSIVASRDLPAGTPLEPADLAVKKPGGGLGPSEMPALLGRRLRTAVGADTPITEALLETQSD